MVKLASSSYDSREKFGEHDGSQGEAKNNPWTLSSKLPMTVNFSGEAKLAL